MYVCHDHGNIYHQYTPVLLASIYHTYGSVMGTPLISHWLFLLEDQLTTNYRLDHPKEHSCRSRWSCCLTRLRSCLTPR